MHDIAFLHQKHFNRMPWNIWTQRIWTHSF